VCAKGESSIGHLNLQHAYGDTKSEISDQMATLDSLRKQEIHDICKNEVYRRWQTTGSQIWLQNSIQGSNKNSHNSICNDDEVVESRHLLEDDLFISSSSFPKIQDQSSSLLAGIIRLLDTVDLLNPRPIFTTDNSNCSNNGIHIHERNNLGSIVDRLRSQLVESMNVDNTDTNANVVSEGKKIVQHALLSVEAALASSGVGLPVYWCHTDLSHRGSLDTCRVNPPPPPPPPPPAVGRPPREKRIKEEPVFLGGTAPDEFGRSVIVKYTNTLDSSWRDVSPLLGMNIVQSQLHYRCRNGRPGFITGVMPDARPVIPNTTHDRLQERWDNFSMEESVRDTRSHPGQVKNLELPSMDTRSWHYKQFPEPYFTLRPLRLLWRQTLRNARTYHTISMCLQQLFAAITVSNSAIEPLLKNRINLDNTQLNKVINSIDKKLISVFENAVLRREERLYHSSLGVFAGQRALLGARLPKKGESVVYYSAGHHAHLRGRQARIPSSLLNDCPLDGDVACVCKVEDVTYRLDGPVSIASNQQRPQHAEPIRTIEDYLDHASAHYRPSVCMKLRVVSTPEDMRVSLTSGNNEKMADATSAVAHPRLIHDAIRVGLDKAFEAIWECDDATLFRAPVSRLEFPDYDQWVKKPIDLSTMKNRLNKYLPSDTDIENIRTLQQWKEYVEQVRQSIMDDLTLLHTNAEIFCAATFPAVVDAAHRLLIKGGLAFDRIMDRVLATAMNIGMDISVPVPMEEVTEGRLIVVTAPLTGSLYDVPFVVSEDKYRQGIAALSSLSVTEAKISKLKKKGMSEMLTIPPGTLVTKTFSDEEDSTLRRGIVRGVVEAVNHTSSRQLLPWNSLLIRWTNADEPVGNAIVWTAENGRSIQWSGTPVPIPSQSLTSPAIKPKTDPPIHPLQRQNRMTIINTPRANPFDVELHKAS